jgi:hypothetical protein
LHLRLTLLETFVGWTVGQRRRRARLYRWRSECVYRAMEAVDKLSERLFFILGATSQRNFTTLFVGRNLFSPSSTNVPGCTVYTHTRTRIRTHHTHTHTLTHTHTQLTHTLNSFCVSKFLCDDLHILYYIFGAPYTVQPFYAKSQVSELAVIADYVRGLSCYRTVCIARRSVLFFF